MARGILAVLAGFTVWSIIWLGSTNGLMAAMPGDVQAGQPITSATVLLILLVVSVIASIISGYITAMIATEKIMTYVMAFGVVNLLVGIFFQVQSWNLMPIWYHVIFLALLIPAIMYGGKLRGKELIINHHNCIIY